MFEPAGRFTAMFTGFTNMLQVPVDPRMRAIASTQVGEDGSRSLRRGQPPVRAGSDRDAHVLHLVAHPDVEIIHCHVEKLWSVTRRVRAGSLRCRARGRGPRLPSRERIRFSSSAAVRFAGVVRGRCKSEAQVSSLPGPENT